MHWNRRLFLLAPAALLSFSGCTLPRQHRHGTLVRNVEWLTVESPRPATPENATALPELDSIPTEPSDQAALLKKQGLKLDFVTYPNGGNPLLSSSAFLGFSRDRLLFYLQGKQSSDYTLRAHRQEKEDGHIWYDDNFEVFVDPFLSRSEYVHFIVNPLGDAYDAKCFEKMVPDPKAADPSELHAIVTHDDAYTSGANVWADPGNGQWGVLFAIPFSDFGLATAPVGQPWGFNFCHTNRENKELTQWQPTAGDRGFHQPRKFGALVFGEAKDAISCEFRLPTPGFGQNVLLLHTQNSGPEATSECNILVTAGDNKVVETRVPVTIPSGRSDATVPFTLPTTAAGRCRLGASLTVGQRTPGYFIQSFVLDDALEVLLPLDQVYTTDAAIDTSLRLHVGAADLTDAQLLLSLESLNTSRQAQPLTVRGNTAALALDHHGLPPGQYCLAIELRSHGRRAAVAKRVLHIIPAPFAF